MRLLQSFLLLIWATLFGLGAGALGAYAGMRMLFEEPRGESFGAAPIWLAVIAFGGIAGAIVGFVAAITRIIHSEKRNWTLFTWLGIALGAAVGVSVSINLPDRIHFWFRLICAAFIVGACTAVGAALAALLARSMKPSKRKKTKSH